MEKDTITTFALDLKESAAFSNVLAEFALPRSSAEELARGVVMGVEGAPDGGLGWVFPVLQIREFYPVDTLTLLHQVLFCAYTEQCIVACNSFVFLV